MSRIHTLATKGAREIITQSEGLLLVHFASPLASQWERTSSQIEQASEALGDSMQFAEILFSPDAVATLDCFQVRELPTVLLFVDGVERERFEEPPTELTEVLGLCLAYYVEKEPE